MGWFSRSQDEKDSLLKEAIWSGATDDARHALEKGASAKDLDGVYLLEAITKKHTDLLSLLLENGADIYADDNAALQTAALQKSPNILKVLLQYYREENDHRNPVRVLKQLLERGEIDAITCFFRTAQDEGINTAEWGVIISRGLKEAEGKKRLQKKKDDIAQQNKAQQEHFEATERRYNCMRDALEKGVFEAPKVDLSADFVQACGGMLYAAALQARHQDEEAQTFLHDALKKYKSPEEYTACMGAAVLAGYGIPVLKEPRAGTIQHTQKLLDTAKVGITARDMAENALMLKHSAG